LRAVVGRSTRLVGIDAEAGPLGAQLGVFILGALLRIPGS
jgi:hypothetical protein